MPGPCHAGLNLQFFNRARFQMANVADYPNGTLAENPNCYDFLLDDINRALEMAGAVSLVFCFVELVGVVLAVLYRRKSLVLWAQERGYTKEIL